MYVRQDQTSKLRRLGFGRQSRDVLINRRLGHIAPIITLVCPPRLATEQGCATRPPRCKTFPVVTVHRTGEGQSWQCRHSPRTAPRGHGPAHGAIVCGWTESLIPQAPCHLRGCRRSRSRSDFSSWRRPLRAASGSERDKIAMGQIFLYSLRVGRSFPWTPGAGAGPVESRTTSSGESVIFCAGGSNPEIIAISMLIAARDICARG